MGFNLVQIVNKILNVQSVGSLNRFFFPINATTTDQLVQFPFSTRKVLISNDGLDDMLFAFDNKKSTGQFYPYNDPSITYAGTWNPQTFAGSIGTGVYADNTNLANSFVFKPSVPGARTITWNAVKGTWGGIAKLELSSDNGVTWKSPSTIPGVARSDVASGTAMDTFDSYDISSSYAVKFYLPYNPSNVWAMRVSTTNTKNPSAGGNSIYTLGNSIGDGTVFILKTKEVMELDVQTTQVNFSSPTSTNGRVSAI